MASFAKISAKDQVLDAGCGIGGSSIFLAKEIGCTVVGITLSEAQVKSAQNNARKNQVSELVSFQKEDYRATSFPDASFDVIWALESAVYDPQKSDFLKEAARLLKPGGRLIMGEYLKQEVKMSKKEEAIFTKWLHSWAMTDLSTLSLIKEKLEKHGFQDCQFDNISANIKKASWRMYYGSYFLGFLSGLYRIYNPQVSHFADNHYKGLRYQYPALKRKLWTYHLIALVKR